MRIAALLLYSNMVVLALPASAGGISAGVIGIESMDPSAGATRVALTPEIVLKIPGLRPESISAATVTVTPEHMPTLSVLADVSYRPQSGALAITPRSALQSGVRYQVVAQGLVALDGEVAQRQVLLQFGTLVNPVTKRVFFRAGLPAQEQEFDYDENVQLLQRTDFGFVAGKRQIQGYTKFLRDVANRVTRDVYYSAAGADSSWLTPDDSVGMYNETTRTIDGMVSREFSAYTSGANGVWFDGDDAGGSFVRYDYNGSRQLIREMHLRGNGADGIAFTADDDVAYGEAMTYYADGALANVTRSARAGADQHWFTVDDDVEWLAVELTASPIGRAVYTAAGSDGVWGTADDVLASYRLTQETPAQLMYVYGKGAGKDGLWFNDDDDIDYYSVYSRDEQGRRIRHAKYVSPGSDGHWFTADDVAERYTDYRYGLHGLLLGETEYNNPGSDGRWFTADDGVRVYRSYQYADNGALLNAAEYAAAGPDGKWFTPDDVIEERTEYDASR